MSEHDQQAAVVKWFKLQYPQYKDYILSNSNGQMLGGKSNVSADFRAYNIEGSSGEIAWCWKREVEK